MLCRITTCYYINDNWRYLTYKYMINSARDENPKSYLKTYRSSKLRHISIFTLYFKK